MKSRIIVLLLISTITVSIFSHETSLHGDNFTVSETERGYLNYFIKDELGNDIPLLESGLVLNSRIFIKDSDKRFYLRDSSEYHLDLQDDVMIIKWVLNTIEVSEKYKKTDTGVKYSINIKNKTGKDRNIGIYLIYDTYMGEKDKNHFIINDDKVLNREKVYEEGDIPFSIRSNNKQGQGIEFRFRDEISSRPDKVILANWEKLAKSKKWPYIPKEGGLFSYGYYSVNDSALGVVFTTRTIKPKDDLVYSFFINFTEKYVKPEEELEVVPEPEEVIVEEVVPDEIITEVEPVEEEPMKEEPAEEEVFIEDTTTDEVANIVIQPEPDDSVSPMDPEKEELLRMLEYIQKRKKGEDVSDFDFDEKYIEKKLKERDE